MKKILSLLNLVAGLLAVTGTLALAKPAHPDSDMKKVLTEMTSQGGKPIESLSATDARNQPTPADAVKSIMSNQRKTDKSNLSEVLEIEIQGADVKIPARLYIPFGKQPLPVVLEDNLMRIFNGERIQKIMTMLNIPEDEHRRPWITLTTSTTT